MIKDILEDPEPSSAHFPIEQPRTDNCIAEIVAGVKTLTELPSGEDPFLYQREAKLPHPHKEMAHLVLRSFGVFHPNQPGSKAWFEKNRNLFNNAEIEVHHPKVTGADGETEYPIDFFFVNQNDTGDLILAKRDYVLVPTEADAEDVEMERYIEMITTLGEAETTELHKAVQALHAKLTTQKTS